MLCNALYGPSLTGREPTYCYSNVVLKTNRKDEQLGLLRLGRNRSGFIPEFVGHPIDER